jgi:hypothetical protein
MSPPKPSELWATIDECEATGTPTLGIGGSMPGDNDPEDTMYMRFHAQYLDGQTGKWADLKGGVRAYQNLGAAYETPGEQAGDTFVLTPGEPGHSFQLRGLVEFQWRKGKEVMFSATRTTTAGHLVEEGAVPPGFSAATCTVG